MFYPIRRSLRAYQAILNGVAKRAELKKLAAALRAAARIGLLSKRDLLESNVK
jgi:hypothetical protein